LRLTERRFLTLELWIKEDQYLSGPNIVSPSFFRMAPRPVFSSRLPTQVSPLSIRSALYLMTISRYRDYTGWPNNTYSK